MAAAVATYDSSVRAAAYLKHKSLVPPEVLRLLQKKDSTKGWVQLLAHFALIIAFGLGQWETKSADGIGLIAHAVLLLLQSLCMAFLFTAFHELTHRTVFSTRFTNVVCGHILGFVICRPFDHYTFYHFNHHKFTGDPTMDPELQDSFIDLKLDNVFSYVAYLSSIPFWIDRCSTLVRHCVMVILPREELFLTHETKRRVIGEANVYVMLYILIGAACWRQPAVWLVVWQWWLLPTLLAQPFLRFYLIAEHHGCAQGDSILSNTRTTETFGWYRWLAWQMPFHAEHHAFPFVPFHQLSNLHHYLRDSIQQQGGCTPGGERGYVGVHIGMLRKFF